MPCEITYVYTREFNGDYRKAARWLKEQIGIDTRRPCFYTYNNPEDTVIKAYRWTGGNTYYMESLSVFGFENDLIKHPQNIYKRLYYKTDKILIGELT